LAATSGVLGLKEEKFRQMDIMKMQAEGFDEIVERLTNDTTITRRQMK